MPSTPSLLDVLGEYFAGGPAGVAAWRERYVDEDVSLRIVGTGSDEWLGGREAWAALADPASHLEGDLRITVHDPEAFERDGVGWAACRPEIAWPDGARIELRWTAVFERVGDRWRLRQLHVSRPSS